MVQIEPQIISNDYEKIRSLLISQKNHNKIVEKILLTLYRKPSWKYDYYSMKDLSILFKYERHALIRYMEKLVKLGLVLKIKSSIVFYKPVNNNELRMTIWKAIQTTL